MVGDRPPPMCWGWGQMGVYLALTIILALTTIPFLIVWTYMFSLWQLFHNPYNYLRKYYLCGNVFSYAPV